MSTRHRPVRTSRHMNARGESVDHSWIKVFSGQLTGVIRSDLPRPALELALFQMTQLRLGSHIVGGWVTATAAHEIGRDPDTISAAMTQLRKADVVRKGHVNGRVDLEFRPDLAYRGRPRDHLEALRIFGRPMPPGPWIKVFLPGIRRLLDDQLLDSQLRALLRLFTLLDTGNVIHAVGPALEAAQAIGVPRSTWCAALKALEGKGYIRRDGGSNTRSITVDPRFAFRGTGRQRDVAISAWRSAGEGP